MKGWRWLFYLTFSAAQWMSAPGLYNLLMNETPDKERSTAAAMTLFCNALAGSAATAGAGILFAHFGYPPVLLGICGAGADGGNSVPAADRPARRKHGGAAVIPTARTTRPYRILAIPLLLFRRNPRAGRSVAARQSRAALPSDGQ